MPRRTNRRELLSDTAIRVLARHGAHGLTHRAVDTLAAVPGGTTSRYFRTRAALLLVAAETVRDRHRAYLDSLATSVIPHHGDLAGALAALISDAEQTNRDLYIARIELALESLRSPELRPILEEVRAASISTARNLAHSAGIELTQDQTDLLGSLLMGITLDRLTLEHPRLATDKVAEALERTITSLPAPAGG